MRKSLFKILILLVSALFFAQCSSNEKEENKTFENKKTLFEPFGSNGTEKNASYDTILAQAYWYSRYNIDAFVLKSQNGLEPTLSVEMKEEIAELFDVHLGDVVAGRKISDGQGIIKQLPAIPRNFFLLGRVFNDGKPSYENPFNGQMLDFSNFKWIEEAPGASQKTTWASFAWTLISEVEWARHFHNDARFGNTFPSPDGAEEGVQERYWGAFLFAHALMQVLEWIEHPEFFDVQEPISRYLVLSALSRFTYLFNIGQIPQSITNRFAEIAELMIYTYFPDDDDINLEERLIRQMDGLYKSLPEVNTPKEMNIALSSLIQYAFYNNYSLLKDEKRANEILEKLEEINRKLLNLEAKTFMEKTHLLCALLEANRVTHKLVYLQRAVPLAQSLLENYEAGSFDGKNSYTTEEIAWVVRTLNMLRLFAGSFVDQEKLKEVFADFFEEIINKGNLQVSALDKKAFEEYEREDDLHHKYPGTPLPGDAGENHGIAPVFISQI